jgi:hypothetical protein
MPPKLIVKTRNSSLPRTWQVICSWKSLFCLNPLSRHIRTLSWKVWSMLIATVFPPSSSMPRTLLLGSSNPIRSSPRMRISQTWTRRVKLTVMRVNEIAPILNRRPGNLRYQLTHQDRLTLYVCETRRYSKMAVLALSLSGICGKSSTNACYDEQVSYNVVSRFVPR